MKIQWQISTGGLSNVKNWWETETTEQSLPHLMKKVQKAMKMVIENNNIKLKKKRISILELLFHMSL